MAGTAVVATFRVRVLAPAPGAAIVDGESTAVTFLGSPMSDKVMEDLKPLLPLVVMESGAELPLAMLIPELPKLMVKVGTIIVRARLRVLVTPPPAAVMLTL